MSNERFQNALKGAPQRVPPIWLMRQAGRYHRHYQRLRREHSFVDLCKKPALSAEAALGPVDDFDFDVAILFSDLLFPLEALGLPLSYSDAGPDLGARVSFETLSQLSPLEEALERLAFQKEALRETRRRLPADKSLVGFVGGPWTLFVYGVHGSHQGNLIEAKRGEELYRAFCERLVPLLVENVRLQVEGGAELVLIFDTAAGELSPDLFRRRVAPAVAGIAAAHPGKVAYYSRGTQPAHFRDSFFQSRALAGVGVDSRWDMVEALALFRSAGFVQGNFDQALLLLPPLAFERELRAYLEPLKRLSPEERAGWVCGLGHGVLPETPEDNVRALVRAVRETFA